jgi:hypothetical protein
VTTPADIIAICFGVILLVIPLIGIVWLGIEYFIWRREERIKQEEWVKQLMNHSHIGDD